MFKILKEVSAPAVFTKGVMRYKQRHYEGAKKLISKAGKWMPSLEDDDYYKSVLLLVESKLGSKISKQRFKDALESLNDSPYKDTVDYEIVVSDLKRTINESIT